MRLKGASTKWRPVCLGLNMLTSQVRVYWIHWGLNKRADTLTHWARKTHICVGNLTIIGSDNGLTPGRRQAIIWTNAGILLFGPSGTNFSDISIEIVTFSFKKMQMKASSAKWRPYCFGLNVLTDVFIYMICILIEVSLEVCSSGSSWQVIIGSGNGLSPVEPEAITWRNDGLVQHFEALMRWFYDTVKWGNFGHFLSLHVHCISHVIWCWIWMVAYHGSYYVLWYFPYWYCMA